MPVKSRQVVFDDHALDELRRYAYHVDAVGKPDPTVRSDTGRRHPRQIGTNTPSCSPVSKGSEQIDAFAMLLAVQID